MKNKSSVWLILIRDPLLDYINHFLFYIINNNAHTGMESMVKENLEMPIKKRKLIKNVNANANY